MSIRHAFGLLSALCFFVLLVCGEIQAVAAAESPSPKVQKQGIPSSEAQADETVAHSLTPGVQASLGEMRAKSAVLVEVSTGTTIYEQNADEPIEPASFTKILTLYLVNEALKNSTARLDDDVLVSEQAWRTGGSKMFLEVGSRVPLKEIIKGIAVVSGNDASVAAGEHLTGSLDAFVELMNPKSQELGMIRSRFLNPHGLPAKGHITTARDMAKMNLAYLRLFPKSLHVHSLLNFSYNGITQPNRNGLLFLDSSVDGLKTGYVSSSGYHLAATAEREGMRLLAVVMGASSSAAREREAMKLLNFGFRFYALAKPFSEEERVSTIRVWKGKRDQLDLYPSETPKFLISREKRNLLRWEVRPAPEVTAPVAENTRLGEVIFYVADTPQKKVPLVNREGLERAGLFKTGRHAVQRLVVANWKIWGAAVGTAVILVVLAITLRRRRTARRSKIRFIR
jgi:D-alanyl-D-alanine carboxypeptidase (penicillin-binding protein 5/6)